jgi:hypothetical protein
MENRDNVRERLAVVAQQMRGMEAQTGTVARRRGGRLTWPVAAVMALALALALPYPVQARTFRCGAGDVGCLIAAINEANTNGLPRNTIRLEAGTYTLTAVDNDTDGPNGLPSVTSTLTIRGAGAETTVIERDASAPAFRLLHVEAPGTLTLDALTLQGGNASGPSGPPAGPGDGGGIFSSGTLTVTHSTLRNNTATGGGGGIGIGPGGPGEGGGIFSSGALTVTHSTLSDNAAAGGSARPVQGGSGSGGGIFSSGTLIVTHSTLSDNTAAGAGEFLGIFRAPGDGGGIFSSGTLIVTNSILSGNTAMGGGDGASSSGGGIFSSSSAPLIVTSSILSGNTVTGPGGGLPTLSEGGGIFSSGPLTVTHSTLRDNTAMGTAQGGMGQGGGIFSSSSSGPLTVTNSTLSGNTATCRNPLGNGQGGGIFSSSGGPIIVTNSTLSGNTAGVGCFQGFGGGISGGPLIVTNSTLSGNMAGSGGGLRSESAALQNTILALNSSTGTAPDCVGLITSLDNNLIGDPTGCTITLQPSDLTGDPGLDTFTDNSRPGNGHFPLLPTSQAIDAGSDTVCPSKDQIGQRRIGPCDIGAIRFRDQDDRRHDEEDDQNEENPAAAAQPPQ